MDSKKPASSGQHHPTQPGASQTPAGRDYPPADENAEVVSAITMRNEIILDSLSDLVIVFDEQYRIVVWNKVVVSIFQIPQDKALGSDFVELVKPFFPELIHWVSESQNGTSTSHSRHILSWQNRHFICKHDQLSAQGGTYHILVLDESTEIIQLQKLLQEEKSKLENRVNERTVELQQEIEEKHEAHFQLEKMAHTDMLTGLPNRQGFLRELKHAIARSKLEPGQNFAVFFIDLDGFKAVNDGFGHHFGDVVLCEIAKRLSALLRGSDLCARLAGDEFVALLPNPGEVATLERIASAMLEVLSTPVVFENEQQVTISGSIGIYNYNATDTEISRILSMADQAMYEAKRRGKNCYALFNQTMWQRLQESSSLVAKIAFALDRGEFFLQFQPVCDMQGRITGVESLARWNHLGQDIPPAKFIPLLEQGGLINRFTVYVINQVFEVLKQHEAIPYISVNLSLQQFHDESFIAYLDYIFADDRPLRRRMRFEITESVLNNDQQMIEDKIAQLRMRDFLIYIDDFGTGYSSFSYIRTFNANVVKIDREFVKDISSNESDLKLLKGMIALMHSLDKWVVIEGVESRAQVDLIASLSNEVHIQGFYFYQPMLLGELLEVTNSILPGSGTQADPTGQYFLFEQEH